MKERIKALMQQAGTDTSGKWMGVEHAEKFAELIVKECAAMTRNLSAHGELAEKAVKEHFGVEE